ncbi:MAG: hypothetical protein AMXMBFR82_11760 [Candidatus Hydrogenedentota bacterium]
MNTKPTHTDPAQSTLKPSPYRGDDKRGLARLPLFINAEYRYGTTGEGCAKVQNIGRAGLRLRMGRYLRPGTVVRLHLEAEDLGLDPIEFTTHIAWCIPVSENGEFDAGLRILHDGTESLAQVSALIHAALLRSGQLCERKGPHAMNLGVTVTPVWRCDTAHAGATLQIGT